MSWSVELTARKARMLKLLEETSLHGHQVPSGVRMHLREMVQATTPNDDDLVHVKTEGHHYSDELPRTGHGESKNAVTHLVVDVGEPAPAQPAADPQPAAKGGPSNPEPVTKA